MLVICPKCRNAIRLNFNKYDRIRLTLRCPGCSARFRARLAGAADFTALIAHEDPAICRQIVQRFQLLKIEPLICHSKAQVSQLLDGGGDKILVLDVAFAGMFPFELIEKAQKTAKIRLHKVVLLPSVYNKTAYKKKPTSLYGADAYLELHHIGDRLLPLVTELFPAYKPRLARLEIRDLCAGERDLLQTDLQAQAEELARLLVADITFYHQERLQQGITKGNLLQLFSGELAEGRRLLKERLPSAAELEPDPVQAAFENICETYRVMGRQLEV